MLRKFIGLALLGFTILQLQLFLAQDWWFFELFTHYAHYYAVLGLLFTLVALYKRLWPTALLLLTFTSLQLGPLDPYLHQNPTATGVPEMTILSSNFFFKNTDFDDFQALLDEENPDLFIIHEAGPQWLPKMNSFKTTYSYIGSTKKLGIHGIIIGSRIPGTFKEITLGTKVGLEFTPENGSYHVLGVHPFAPITSADAKERNQQFEDIATYVHLSKVPVIVMGDFNCTPWSPYFKDLLKKADLHDARFGFGLLPTWHAHNFFFKLPIDHALLHGPWEVFDFYGARALTGSDHLPIVVKLSL